MAHQHAAIIEMALLDCEHHSSQKYREPKARSFWCGPEQRKAMRLDTNKQLRLHEPRKLVLMTQLDANAVRKWARHARLLASVEQDLTREEKALDSFRCLSPARVGLALLTAPLSFHLGAVHPVPRSQWRRTLGARLFITEEAPSQSRHRASHNAPEPGGLSCC
jgi:hypothetical protein